MLDQNMLYLSLFLNAVLAFALICIVKEKNKSRSKITPAQFWYISSVYPEFVKPDDVEEEYQKIASEEDAKDETHDMRSFSTWYEAGAKTLNRIANREE